jgi:ABC-type nickel/cobalt efflux system permease component RcnA
MFYLLILFITAAAWANIYSPKATEDSVVQNGRTPTQTMENTAFEGITGIPGARLLGRLRGNLLTRQRKLQARISGSFREMEKNQSRRLYFSVFVLAFLFGFFHSLGPGHGKIVLGAYFISNGGRIIQGLFAGTLTAAVHVASAVIIVLFGYYSIAGSLLATTQNAETILQAVTARAIILLGLTMLALRLYSRVKNNREQTEARAESPRSVYLLSFFTGLVPCPGVIFILLFSINLSLVSLGIFAVSGVFAGMALGISTVSMGILFSRRFFTSRRTEFFGHRVLINTFSYLGMVMIILSGTLLL